MRFKYLLLVGTALIGATPAFATSQPADATAMPQPVADAEEAVIDDPQSSDGLTEIVVTATKRETNLQETPIAINVMGNEEIKKRHVQSLLDLADGGIPSLRVATYESRQSALTIGIRGIVPGDANQPAREQGVGVYVDGVYLGRQHGLNAALFDIDRIEVLKGPQGTLFGRNTEGGALNIVTKRPTGEFGGTITAGVGNFGSYTTAAHINLSEFMGLSIKFDGLIDHQNATVKNPLAGQLGWNYHHRKGGRVSAHWEFTDSLSADFAYDISRDENTPFYSQLINYNPNNYPVATLEQIQANGGKLPAGYIAPLPDVVQVSPDRMNVGDIGVPQQASVDDADGFMGMLRWKIMPGLELRSITSWRGVDAEQWDNSGGAHRSPAFLPNANFSRYSLSFLNQTQFSQELQAIGGFGNVDYVAGVYYYNEHAGEIAATPNSNKWNADGTGYTINNPASWAPENWSISRATRASSKSYAAYGQLTWNPVETLHITAGGRYTQDRKSGVLYKVSNKDTNFPFKFNGNRFDPLVTVAWQPADHVNLYAKYATGYRAGGASSRSITFASFGPESVHSYEVGAKTELFDRRVRFNLAGYIMDRKNSQFDFDFYILQPNGTVRHTLETVNASGITKIRGIEADVTVRPTDNLSLNASYAYTYWKVPPTPNPLVEGNPLQPLFIVYTPKHALSGSIDYDLPLSDSSDMALKFHMDGNYASSAYTFDNEPVKADPSFIVNARLSLADIPMNNDGPTLSLSIWSRNLFNEQHIYRRSNANSDPIDGNYLTVVGDYANFNAPRTFGLEAAMKF